MIPVMTNFNVLGKRKYQNGFDSYHEYDVLACTSSQYLLSVNRSEAVEGALTLGANFP